MSIFKFDNKEAFLDTYLIERLSDFTKAEIIMYLSFTKFVKEEMIITKETLTNTVVNELSLLDCTTNDEKEKLLKQFEKASEEAVEGLKEKGLIVEFENEFILTKTIPNGEFVSISKDIASNLSETLLEEDELKQFLKVVFDTRRQGKNKVSTNTFSEQLTEKLFELLLIDENDKEFELYL